MLIDCDTRNPELHLLMQNWEVPIVFRKTIAPAAFAVAAGLCAIHSLHMLFSCEGLYNPAVMESMGEAQEQQEQLNRKEQSLKTTQKTALLAWAAWWNGLMTGDSMYLFVLSQILVRKLLVALKWWDASYKLSWLCRIHGGHNSGFNCSCLISAATCLTLSLLTAPALGFPVSCLILFPFKNLTISQQMNLLQLIYMRVNNSLVEKWSE